MIQTKLDVRSISFENERKADQKNIFGKKKLITRTDYQQVSILSPTQNQRIGNRIKSSVFIIVEGSLFQSGFKGFFVRGEQSCQASGEHKRKSTVRKKMVTGTFTYNGLHTKTLKERIKTHRQIVSHSTSTRAILLVQVRLSLSHIFLYPQQTQFGMQGIVVKCTAVIFLLMVDSHRVNLDST